MKVLSSLKLAAVLVVTVVAALAFGSSQNHVAAHEASSSQKNDATYSYTAQTGDSYTKIARKAVQTYGAINKVGVSQAGIIFAETNLTQAAGSPELNVGQKIEITESTIHEWVDKAQALTGSQEAAWNYYVQFVNFNTDNIGESS